MKKKLPLLTTVSHGGTRVPDEVEHLIRLSKREILLDNDTWAGELFSLDSHVVFHLLNPVARAVIDMNRDPGDRPPQNTDGVVKTMTVFGEQIWKQPKGLPQSLTEKLIAGYHKPFHEAVAREARRGKAVLGVDCHTMLPAAPPGSPRPGEKRPLICLSNRGGEDGLEKDGPVTAPARLLLALKESLLYRLSDEIAAFPVLGESVPAVAINSPFKGGYIIHRHGGEGVIPWIMVEINRLLYLPPGSLPEVPDPTTKRKMETIKGRFLSALAEAISALSP